MVRYSIGLIANWCSKLEETFKVCQILFKYFLDCFCISKIIFITIVKFSINSKHFIRLHKLVNQLTQFKKLVKFYLVSLVKCYKLIKFLKFAKFHLTNVVKCGSGYKLIPKGLQSLTSLESCVRGWAECHGGYPIYIYKSHTFYKVLKY